ncbi:MAG: outer membrane beta-barrel protein [Bacteroidales bacterium]
MKIIELTNKVFLACSTVVLLLGGSANAQDIGKPLSFGIRAGISESVLTMDNQPTTYYRISPIVGGYVQYRVLPWVSVSLDAIYTQYGGNGVSPLFFYSPDSPVLDNLGKTDFFIHSCEVPIAVKVGLPNFSSSVRPFLSIGASAAFFFQANAINYFIVDNGSDFPYYYKANDVVTSRVKTFDMSFIPGTGVEFIGERFSYSIEIFYRMGLSSLNETSKTYIPDYKANAFGVKIGIGL